MEIQQSPLYTQYIQSLGWHVKRLQGTNIFYRYFPLLGGLAKIQRPQILPPLAELIPFLKENKIKTVALEPDTKIKQTQVRYWCQRLKKYFKLNRTPFIPTKTILIDLTHSEEEIFARFSEAKRRAVRRALKNAMTAEESSNITDLIRVKNQSEGFLGLITTYGIDRLWPIFAPQHATTLLARTHLGKVVGGILLLFWDKRAYYWIAGATKEGKKLFAPTLLVWEALKLAKKRDQRVFDFVGVWDERSPKKNHDWLGFTKFKEGFGGKPLYYPTL